MTFLDADFQEKSSGTEMKIAKKHNLISVLINCSAIRLFLFAEQQEKSYGTSSLRSLFDY